MSKYNNNLFSIASEFNTETLQQDFISVLDPEIPKLQSDIYVVSTFGDRLDLLAFKYYQNATYWWIIAAANPELRKDTLNLEIATQIRIPRNFQSVISILQQQIISR